MCSLITEGKNTINCLQQILHKHQQLQTTISKLVTSCTQSPKIISCLEFVEVGQIQWEDVKTGGG